MSEGKLKQEIGKPSDSFLRQKALAVAQAPFSAQLARST
jgi:hypothetical protein